jgi:predicted secreted protein
MTLTFPFRPGGLFGKPSVRDDARGGRFVVVIECLLNQNARDRGAAAYPALNDAVLALCARHGVGLLQLPCPEIRCLGPDRARPPGVRIRDRLDTPAGRQCCREISDEVVERVRGYLAQGVELLAILGGNPESPGCAVHPAASGGEAPDGRSGILMQTLAEALEAASIRVPFRGIRDCRPEWLEADLRWLEERFRP